MKNFFDGRAPLDRRVFWALCLAICLLGLGLRLPTLASRSLWLDETYSAWFSTLPLRELWTTVPLYETHPPMYYTLLKAWGVLFGTSEVALRSLSVLASVATLFILATSGRLLRAGAAVEKAALVAALFLAVNRGHIEYAQQARPYALETLSAAVAILLSVMLLRRLAQGTDATLKQLWPTIIGLGVAGGFTLWLHNTAIFIAFGIWAGLALALLTSVRGNRWVQCQALAISGVLALLIWSPFVPLLLQQSANVAKMSFWISFQRKDVLSAWYLAGGGERAIIPIALLSLLGAWAVWRRERYSALHLLTVLIVPLAVVLGYSYLVKPIYISRLFEWLAPPLMMLAALGAMAGLKKPALRAIAVLVVVVVSFHASSKFYTMETEDWRALAATVAARAQPGDVMIVLPNELNVPLKYYAANAARFPDMQYIPAPFPALDLVGHPYMGNLGAPAIVAADTKLVRDAMASHRRVWLMTRREWMYDPHNIVRNEVAASRKLVGSYGATGIKLDLYE
ncbi:MAG: glycosyltransferase family 39 protein [Duganella sp.]